MNSIFTMLLGLFVSAAPGPKKQFQYELKIIKDGMILSTPTIIGLENEEAEIEQGDVDGPKMKFAIIGAKSAFDSSQMKIDMKFSNRESKDAKRFKTKKSLLVPVNSEYRFQEANSEGNYEFVLKVKEL